MGGFENRTSFTGAGRQTRLGAAAAGADRKIIKSRVILRQKSGCPGSVANVEDSNVTRIQIGDC
jgi:hypothetical protein